MTWRRADAVSTSSHEPDRTPILLRPRTVKQLNHSPHKIGKTMENKNVDSKSLLAGKSEGSKKSNRGVKGERVKLPSNVTAAGVASANPHARFLYHGGAVVLNPQVFAIYLGNWTSAASQARAVRLGQYLTRSE